MTGKPSHQELTQKIKDLEKKALDLECSCEELGRVEEALRQSEALYRLSIEDAPHGVMVIDSELKIRVFNSHLEKLSGYKKEEMPDRDTWIELMYPEENYRRQVADEIRKIDPAERPRVREATITRKDGTKRICQFISSFLPGGLRIVFIKNISDQKHVEKALQESEEKYRQLVEHANDAIVVAQDGRVGYANPRTLEMTGFTKKELVGAAFSNLIHQDDRAMVLNRHKLRQDGESNFSNYTFRAYSKTGDQLWLQINSVQITWNDRPAVLSFIRDITHEKRLENQLIQSQKMEAIGTLAGGIAHDFNNLMAAIQGNVSLAMYDLDSDHPIYRNLVNIEKQIESGAKLTSQLLGYAKKGKYEIKPIDLNDLVTNSAGTLGRTKKEISIEYELTPDLFSIEADRGQIEQILLNLYVNAVEAMPLGGKLTIKTTNSTESAIESDLYTAQKGNYVHLSISDSGEGIDREIQSRIFDPFFTTKDLGGGTGMGLASVYGIVKGHNGYIEVESEIGRGTTFHIYLPASKKAAGKPVRGRSNIFQGQETLLLVDDEEMVLDVGAQLLERLGYTVLTARSGREAINCFQESQNSIDLVILDIVMPEMGGAEVYARLKEIDPRIKVLLSSGYSIDGQAREILDQGCDGFIQKPFKLNKLSRKIDDILKQR